MKNHYSFHHLIAYIVVVICTASCTKNDNEPKNQVNNQVNNQVQSEQQQRSGTTATVQNDPMSRFEKKNTDEQVAFSVSGDQIEKFINDSELGISFAPPRGYAPILYNALPSDISTKFTIFNNSDANVTPKYSFRKQENLVVSVIDFKKSGVSYEKFLGKYEALLQERFVPATITRTFFMKGTIKITQFFIQETERGLFRIVFPSQVQGKALQFDFSLRRQTAQDNMQAIEPSIGTITYIPINVK